TTSINDDTRSPIVEDEQKLEQIMVLKLLWLLCLCAKHSLHNDAPEGCCVLATQNIAALHSLFCFFFFIIFNVGGTDVAIFCSNVCPLTWAILPHMSKSMAAVALNCHASSRG